MTAKIIKSMARNAFLDFGASQHYRLESDGNGQFFSHATRRAFFIYNGAFQIGYITGAKRMDIALKALQAIAEGNPAPRTAAQDALRKLEASK
jgi:hypothetical protein